MAGPRQGPTGRCRGRQHTSATEYGRVPSRHHSPFLALRSLRAFRRGGPRSRRGPFPAGSRAPRHRRGPTATAAGRRRGSGPRRAGGTGGGGGRKFAATIASNSARTHSGSASTSSLNASAAAERALLSGIVVHSPDRLAMSPGPGIRIAPDGDRFKSSKDRQRPVAPGGGDFSGCTRVAQPPGPRSPDVPGPGPIGRARQPSTAPFSDRSVAVQCRTVGESPAQQGFAEIASWPVANAAAYGHELGSAPRNRPRRRRTAWFPDGSAPARPCSPWW